jgi:hypothetical protein
MDWRDVGIRLSYQIQRKRKKREEATGKKNTTSPFSPIPEIIFSFVLFISFSIDMQG